MKRECVRVGIAAGVFFCSLWAFAQGGAGNEVKGTVQEGGFGKFKLQDKSGTSWLFYLSKDGTAYKPDDWRPTVGDEVTVAHMEVQRRGASISQATSVTLVKAGPNTARITSPVEVEIVESGRRGYKAKIVSSGTTVQFDIGRSMKVVPAGWVPAPGEKAIMTFTAKPSKFSFGITYALDKVEKVVACGKAE